VAILARGRAPIESRRGLPGDPDDSHSRYLEAAVDGLIVACLYLPNGNPQPGPKFDYKLAWFERFIKHAGKLHASGHPVLLCGDFNVVPTDFDIYNPRSWRKDALLQPESREAYARLLAQGWTDALRATHPEQRIYTFWDYFRRHWETDSGLRIDHLLLSDVLAPRLRAAGVDRWVRGEPGASDHAPTWIELAWSPAAKSPARQAAAGQAAARKAPAKKSPARKAATKKAATKKAATKQAAANTIPTKKSAPKKLPAAKKTPARRRAIPA
jgi:exodeoxyribonuclease III